MKRFFIALLLVGAAMVALACSPENEVEELETVGLQAQGPTCGCEFTSGNYVHTVIWDFASGKGKELIHHPASGVEIPNDRTFSSLQQVEAYCGVYNAPTNCLQ